MAGVLAALAPLLAACLVSAPLCKHIDAHRSGIAPAWEGKPCPGQQLQRETFQQDHQTLGKLGFVITQEVVLSELQMKMC